MEIYRQPVCLRNIKGIRLKAQIKVCESVPKKEFNNYFRLFKPKEESVEENSFYSPFFARGCVISMGEHYGDRKNATDAILKALGKERCLSVYLSYDFRLAAVNEEYRTDGEFEHIKHLVESALSGTGLYLFFMASHFNQLAGKPLRTKTEHYHLLLCEDAKMSEKEYATSVRRFADNLRRGGIDVELD